MQEKGAETHRSKLGWNGVLAIDRRRPWKGSAMTGRARSTQCQGLTSPLFSPSVVEHAFPGAFSFFQRWDDTDKGVRRKRGCTTLLLAAWSQCHLLHSITYCSKPDMEPLKRTLDCNKHTSFCHVHCMSHSRNSNLATSTKNREDIYLRPPPSMCLQQLSICL